MLFNIFISVYDITLDLESQYILIVAKNKFQRFLWYDLNHMIKHER